MKVDVEVAIFDPVINIGSSGVVLTFYYLLVSIFSCCHLSFYYLNRRGYKDWSPNHFLSNLFIHFK